MSIGQTICDSDNEEKFYDETLAVIKINSDPNFFFTYAKTFSICTKAMGPPVVPSYPPVDG